MNEIEDRAKVAAAMLRRWKHSEQASELGATSSVTVLLG